MIYYIYHSAFAIELKENILIFDFYKIPKEKKIEEQEFFKRFVERRDKQVFVFATHSHADHFNPKILEWKYLNDSIIYILSSDIKIPYNDENFIFTREGDTLELPYKLPNSNIESKLRINTFGSTDLGSSFYVNIENKNIFHAGDLHFWHWEDDSEIEEKEMRDKYISILKEVQRLEKIDIAFTAVDPRLGANVYEGVELFWDILKPKVLVPMHFSDDYSAMKGFLERFKNVDVEVIEIEDSMIKIME